MDAALAQILNDSNLSDVTLGVELPMQFWRDRDRQERLLLAFALSVDDHIARGGQAYYEYCRVFLARWEAQWPTLQRGSSNPMITRRNQNQELREAFTQAAVRVDLHRAVQAGTRIELPDSLLCYAQDASDYFKDILHQSLSSYQEYRIDTSCYPPITQLYPEFTEALGDPFLDVCMVPDPDDDPVTPTIGEDSLTSVQVTGYGYSVFHLGLEDDKEEERVVGALESVEKLACLILFSEHIIAFCDKRWEEVDTSGVDIDELLNSSLELELEVDGEDVREEPEDNPVTIVDVARKVNLKLELEISNEPLITLEPMFEEKLKLTQRQSVEAPAVFTGRDRVNVMDVDTDVLGMAGVKQGKEIAFPPVVSLLPAYRFLRCIDLIYLSPPHDAACLALHLMPYLPSASAGMAFVWIQGFEAQIRPTKAKMATTTTAELTTLAYAKYGKTNVRVFRIVRGEGGVHTVVEYSVETLLEGDIETSYTQADNSVVVATDSVKNITYFLAKSSPHILSPEKFALHIGTFFVSKYAHIHKVHVTVNQLRWSRITVDGKEHKHSFFRDGDDKRVVKATVDATQGKHALTASLTSGLTDLLVLKSTGSAFENFYRDEFTTLVAVDDRIFSTSIDLSYQFSDIKIVAPQDDKKLEFQVPLKQGDEGFAGSVWDDSVAERARTATLEVFATDESASVQATLYKMGQRVIAENAGIKEVTYTLPNKHYIPVDMKYIGIDNLTPLRLCTSQNRTICQPVRHDQVKSRIQTKSLAACCPHPSPRRGCLSHLEVLFGSAGWDIGVRHRSVGATHLAKPLGFVSSFHLPLAFSLT
ncbi:hypothetical protein NMY22_g11854 [Coprinellus aureogranulatus]|nr:hypothetical protein NMY22_g11854 [Coprinellus aureogranulatus]